MAKARTPEVQPVERDRQYPIKVFSTKLFKDAIDRYATANKLSMSDAVIVLCAEQLGLDRRQCISEKLPSGRKRQKG